MKKCSACKLEKDRIYKNRQCNQCTKEKNKKYYENNKEEIKEQRKKYYENNKKEIKARHKEYYENNKEEIKARHKEYCKNNKEEIKQQKKEYHENNKEEILIKKKEYYQKNKKEINKHSKEYHQNNKEKISGYYKNRYTDDRNFRIRQCISNIIRKRLKKNGSSKNKRSFIKHVPWLIVQLKEHLERQFEPWMNWDNYGIYVKQKWDDNDMTTWTWQIDHIIPHSTFNYKSMEDEEFKKCWALENLRPLSSKQNFLDGVSRTRHTSSAST